MKKESIIIEKHGHTDASSATSSLFCGAADPETNDRLHLPVETAHQQDEKPLDLEAVRTSM